MANYKFSYTAEEIEELLGKVKNGVPFFDLAEMGLPAVTPGGDRMSCTVDTEDVENIFAALDKGAVKFGLKVYQGGEAPIFFTLTGTRFGNAYQCTAIFNYGTAGDFLVAIILNGNVIACEISLL